MDLHILYNIGTDCVDYNLVDIPVNLNLSCFVL